jgi:hypothetical protein
MPGIFLPELQELIACSVPVQEENNTRGKSRYVLLEERKDDRHGFTGEDDRTIISRVEIKNLPQNVFVFKADAFPQPQILFNDVKQVRKRADFILIASEANGKNRIVFIEMKKNKDNSHEITSQLRGAACVMDYCNSVLRRFWNDSAAVNNYEERYVTISSNQGKRPTRITNNEPLHDTPEKKLRLTGLSFTYRQLIRH